MPYFKIKKKEIYTLIKDYSDYSITKLLSLGYEDVYDYIFYGEQYRKSINLYMPNKYRSKSIYSSSIVDLEDLEVVLENELRFRRNILATKENPDTPIIPIKVNRIENEIAFININNPEIQLTTVTNLVKCDKDVYYKNRKVNIEPYISINQTKLRLTIFDAFTTNQSTITFNNIKEISRSFHLNKKKLPKLFNSNHFYLTSKAVCVETLEGIRTKGKTYQIIGNKYKNDRGVLSICKNKVFRELTEEETVKKKKSKLSYSHFSNSLESFQAYIEDINNLP